MAGKKRPGEMDALDGEALDGVSAALPKIHSAGRGKKTGQHVGIMGGRKLGKNLELNEHIEEYDREMGGNGFIGIAVGTSEESEEDEDEEGEDPKRRIGTDAGTGVEHGKVKRMARGLDESAKRASSSRKFFMKRTGESETARNPSTEEKVEAANAEIAKLKHSNQQMRDELERLKSELTGVKRAYEARNREQNEQDNIARTYKRLNIPTEPEAYLDWLKNSPANRAPANQGNGGWSSGRLSTRSEEKHRTTTTREARLRGECPYPCSYIQSGGSGARKKEGKESGTRKGQPFSWASTATQERTRTRRRMGGKPDGDQTLNGHGTGQPHKGGCLAKRLSEVVAEYVEVSRPERVADLRIAGLDESVTTEELMQAVAEKGGYRTCKVEVGEILSGPGGSGFAKVRCPVEAAKKVAEGDRLKVGWSLARVTALGPPPSHCFRCMGRGHVANRCPSREDRSGLCFSRISGNMTLDLSKELNTSKDAQLGEDGQYHFEFSMTFEELDSLITTVSYPKRKGHCDCGSLLHGRFRVANNEAVFTCDATRGTGQCSNTENFDNVENDEKYKDLNSINEDDEDNNDTEWSELGKKLYENVVSTLDDNGLEENALHNKELTKKLLRDIKKIPLWSCISYNKFQTGRIPPSSAPVESEIARLKRGIFKIKKGLRVDAAVEEHIKYLLGRTSVVDANIEEQLATKNETYKDEVSDNARDEDQTYDACPACKDDSLTGPGFRGFTVIMPYGAPLISSIESDVFNPVTCSDCQTSSFY
ncbi:unnamed protein product [Chilo suppressalis]|uniref:CCHC-type domain-containing protein n=1 Tax=Chilo suppressalis TaxID=168631 RepID=A0ABN8B8C9_CHISP|nr:unnamed protein product [Chilo suppressalis]